MIGWLLKRNFLHNLPVCFVLCYSGCGVGVGVFDGNGASAGDGEGVIIFM